MRSKDVTDDTVTLPVADPGPPPTISFGTIVKETGVAASLGPDSSRGLNPDVSKVVGASGEHAARTIGKANNTRSFGLIIATISGMTRLNRDNDPTQGSSGA